MSDAEEKPAEGEGSSAAEKSSRFTAWKRFIPKRWLPILLVSTIIAHLLLLSMRSSAPIGQMTIPYGEVSLGEFHFNKHPGSPGEIAKAEFQLHISLLKDMDSKAKARLEERKFKVQQDVEELLRQSHGGDFDDPQLSELKRQLQEQINASLELRAISEVIITDLDLTRDVENLKERYPVSTSSDPFPASPQAPSDWKEAPAG